MPPPTLSLSSPPPPLPSPRLPFHFQFPRRAALYRFAEADNDWKERARGDLKVLKHKETGKYRLVMHAEKILKLRLNQFVGDIELKPNVGSETSWTWRWVDYATDSGDAETHSFGIRFRTKDIAVKFKDVWDMAREHNYPKGGEPAAATASEEKKEEDKKEEDKKEEEKPATE